MDTPQLAVFSRSIKVNFDQCAKAKMHKTSTCGQNIASQIEEDHEEGPRREYHFKNESNALGAQVQIIIVK